MSTNFPARVPHPNVAFVATLGWERFASEVCSTITTASAPAGSEAPVMIPIACPRPTEHIPGSGQSPAFTSPTTSSRAGTSTKSAARTAYPSRVARSKGGKSRSARIPSASTRPNPATPPPPPPPPAYPPSRCLPDTRRPRAARPGAEPLQSSPPEPLALWQRDLEKRTCENHTARKFALGNAKNRASTLRLNERKRPFLHPMNHLAITVLVAALPNCWVFLRAENRELRTALPRQFLSQHGRITGKAKAGFQVHQARANQLRDLSIEVLHAFVLAGLDGIQQRTARPLALFDAIASARVGFQNLDHGNTITAIGTRNQSLRNDVAESFRDTFSYRLVFGGSESTHDPLHRLRGIDSVHAGKNEVAVFGGFEKNFERLPVADFANHNHARRLAQCGP